MNLGKSLVDARKKCGLSQERVAEKLGVKHNSISSWENGINSIDIEILFRICNIFNISINDMFSREPVKREYYTETEQAIIRQYRAKPELQQAIHILLGLPH